MKRITPLQKQIIEAHLAASTTDKFDYDIQHCGQRAITSGVLNSELRLGKTFKQLHNEVELYSVSITSQLMANPKIFGHKSDAYKKQYTAGFKKVLIKLGIE